LIPDVDPYHDLALDIPSDTFWRVFAVIAAILAILSVFA
jgi:hypothetical protein